MISDMEYKVLGQVSAFTGETRVKLGGKRQRLVLAVLLANANRVVSQDALLDAVWSGDLPEGGARTLHTYISILRRTLGESIDRDGSGYVLEVAPDQLDAHKFEALVAEARPKIESDPLHATELLRRGLSLWTGPAYGDLGYEVALIPEVSRLTTARAAALEARFETDLLLGRHVEVIPEAEAMLQEHPYRENVAAILMLALYRSARQAEALRVYRRTRERLVDELGIEPGERLQALELRILESDPQLNAPSTNRRARASPQGARGYELHEQIGAMRLGARYRGFQETLGREVAVLVIDETHANSPRFIQRFEVEMQVVSRFDHPHLAPIFDYWRDPNQACVVTPFYRGGTIETALENGELSIAGAVRLCDQLTDALGFLHRQDYNHGCIDAASVFIDEDMNAFLCDTGLAETVTPASDGRAEDIRQLGELIFHALTLHRPNAESRISGCRQDLPSDLDHAFARAFHPDPRLRYDRVEDFARAVRQSVGLDVMAMPGEAHSVDSSDVERRNPYKGLRAFHEVDANDFYGRDMLVDEMVDAITKTRLLAVVGPSGSGKSSAVRAGLLPKLRQGAVTTTQRLLIVDMFPGAYPFESLEAALMRVARSRPPDLYERLNSDADGISNAVEELLPDEHTGLVIFIDQFEELFSLTASSSERNRFLNSLANAVRNTESRLRIILTLRADFFDQPLHHPEFAEILRSSVVTVSPPTRDGLARAIAEPAKRVGISLEPGLVTQIVDDVREQPGGLPLLQFTLTELFTQREGDLLSRDAYEALGGVGGTLAKRAEETYSSLPPDAQVATRHMFLRLVAVDELADDTRRRVRQSELLDIEVSRTVMRTVIQRFGALRFLSFDRDVASRAPIVELAHEAILKEWHRLRTWIDERREDLLVHRRIQMTVQDWREADRDPSFLLRGVRLHQAMAWIDRTDIAVSEEERKLIEESIEFDEAERAERETLEQKAARRRKAAIWILAGAAAVASVLGLYAIGQRGEALQSASEATARELSQAAIAITEDDPQLGILLAAEAIEVARQAGSDPLPESLGALWSAYIANRVELTIPKVGTQAIAYSPDGSELAVDSVSGGDGVVTIRDAATGEEVGRLSSTASDAAIPAIQVQYSPDGRWIVVARGEFGQEGSVEIFDAGTHEIAHRIPVTGDGGFSFSGTGLLAVGDLVDVGAFTIDLTTWDLESGEMVSHLHDVLGLGGTGVGAPMQFIPGSPIVALGLFGTGQPRFVGFNTVTEEIEWAVPIDIEPFRTAVSPSGSLVAVSNLEAFTVYDLPTGQQLFEPISHQDPQTLVWNPDSTQLAVSGNESDVILLDAATGETRLVLSGHGASVWATSFEPEGERLASVSFDGAARVWNVTPVGATGAPVDSAGRLSDVDVTDDRTVINLVGEGARVITSADGAEIQHHPYEVYVPVRPMVAEKAGLIAGIEADGTASIAKLDSAEITRVLPRCSSPSAISPDGRYLILDSNRVGLPASCAGVDTGVSGIYDVDSNRVLVDYGDSHVRFGAISGTTTFDGGRYAAAGIFENGRSRVEVWQVDPLAPLGTLTDTMAGQLPTLLLTFSSDARYLAVGTNGPRALAVDVAALASGSTVDEAIVFNQEVHTGNVALARVTDDGMMVTSSFDGFYRFWDLLTGELRFEMGVDNLMGYGAHDLSPDGEYFYYEDGSGIVRRMPADINEMIVLATDSVTRGFTDDECRRYLHTNGCE